MHVTKTARRSLVVIAMCAGTLLMIAPIAAQSDPNTEQATIDAMVQAYFDQTATATAQFEQTQTLQAAFEAAQTATSAFNATVQTAFEQAATATQQALPTPTRMPVPERVAATHTINLRAAIAGQTAFLSPDGTRLAHVDLRTLCIYTLEGVEERCVSLEDHDLAVDAERIVWSPDGRYLAMTEDYFIRLDESDIWVLDVDTGSLTNITDDGETGGFLSIDREKSLIDVAPLWLADGRVAFLRITRSEGGTSTSVYAIQPDGSDLGLITSITNDEGMSVFAFDLSPDGRYLAYNWQRATDEKASGLWLRDLESGADRLLVEAEFPVFLPMMISFSPDGQSVLWMDGRYGATRAPSEPEDSPMRALSLDGGEPMLLDEDALVYAAWWAPEGEALAYLVLEQQNPGRSGLFVSPAAGETGTQVLEGLYVPLVMRNYTPNIWSENNTIVLSNAPEEGLTVVQLGN